MRSAEEFGRRSDREKLQGELREGADRGVFSEGSVRPALRERGSDFGVECARTFSEPSPVVRRDHQGFSHSAPVRSGRELGDACIDSVSKRSSHVRKGEVATVNSTVRAKVWPLSSSRQSVWRSWIGADPRNRHPNASWKQATWVVVDRGIGGRLRQRTQRASVSSHGSASARRRGSEQSALHRRTSKSRDPVARHSTPVGSKREPCDARAQLVTKRTACVQVHEVAARDTAIGWKVGTYRSERAAVITDASVWNRTALWKAADIWLEARHRRQPLERPSI